MQYLRLILLPFSLIYGAVIWLRNKAYDTGIFSSRKFNLPVICIGNLTVGGAGKSPMAEYLIRLLSGHYKVAVLSRGYGRKTKGFRLVEPSDSVSDTGDEPLQFKRKFTDVTVAVSEKRVPGIERLEKAHDLVLLDDAFQHRAVTPGLSILLFDFTRLKDFFLMLPAGNLREPFSGRKRADVIVITKTAGILNPAEKASVLGRIKPFPHQRVLFSYLRYGDLKPVFSGTDLTLGNINKRSSVFLLSGIANPAPLVKKLKEMCGELIHHEYPDHHSFSTKNIAKLANEFNASASAVKIIITTEKDAQRIRLQALQELLNGLPVYYLPVEAKIEPADEADFNSLIEHYVAGYLQHH